MARKTVRVEIPNGKPDELIQLAKQILVKHGTDGEASPLDNAKMIKLKNAVDASDTSHTSAKQFDAQAQTARQQRDTKLGVAKGQTANTPDTALNLIAYARDHLLLVNDGTEEALGEYGFNVVVGTAKSPTRVPQPAHA